jgi:hypothetical protein
MTLFKIGFPSCQTCGKRTRIIQRGVRSDKSGYFERQEFICSQCNRRIGRKVYTNGTVRDEKVVSAKSRLSANHDPARSQYPLRKTDAHNKAEGRRRRIPLASPMSGRRSAGYWRRLAVHVMRGVEGLLISRSRTASQMFYAQAVGELAGPAALDALEFDQH